MNARRLAAVVFDACVAALLFALVALCVGVL